MSFVVNTLLWGIDQGLHLDPAIYLMNEESGGFGSGAVQMKALPSSADTAAVTGVAKDGTLKPL